MQQLRPVGGCLSWAARSMGGQSPLDAPAGAANRRPAGLTRCRLEWPAQQTDDYRWDDGKAAAGTNGQDSPTTCCATCSCRWRLRPGGERVRAVLAAAPGVPPPPGTRPRQPHRCRDAGGRPAPRQRSCRCGKRGAACRARAGRHRSHRLSGAALPWRVHAVRPSRTPVPHRQRGAGRGAGDDPVHGQDAARRARHGRLRAGARSRRHRVAGRACADPRRGPPPGMGRPRRRSAAPAGDGDR